MMFTASKNFSASTTLYRVSQGTCLTFNRVSRQRIRTLRRYVCSSYWQIYGHLKQLCTALMDIFSSALLADKLVKNFGNNKRQLWQILKKISTVGLMKCLQNRFQLKPLYNYSHIFSIDSVLCTLQKYSLTSFSPILVFKLENSDK